MKIVWSQRDVTITVVVSGALLAVILSVLLLRL